MIFEGNVKNEIRVRKLKFFTYLNFTKHKKEYRDKTRVTFKITSG